MSPWQNITEERPDPLEWLDEQAELCSDCGDTEMALQYRAAEVEIRRLRRQLNDAVTCMKDQQLPA